jgi:transposase
MSQELFDREECLSPISEQMAEVRTARPRLRIPVRDQVEFQTASLDQLLPPDHEARVIWSAVCQLDLGSWLGEIKAVEGQVGRDATTPQLLVALWVYATLRGIASARELERLCQNHLAYRWLCGGVSVNHHLLSDFRSDGGDQWDALLTQLVAALMSEGLVTLDRVAQDGMKVRASAGKSSFRRKATLEKCLEEARQQVSTLRQLAAENPTELSARQQAARQRAAEERQARLEEALRHVDQVQAQREVRAQRNNQPVKEARASTTDPEARVMQFSDGGTRPGVNVQFSTDTASGLIVGVDVTNAGNDQGQLGPMLDQLQERYGQTPDEALVDGGFASHDDIEDAATEHQCRVLSPLKSEQKELAAGGDPYAPKRRDSEIIAQWRARMGTAEAQQTYRLRAQTAEWVNAQARNRNLWRMPVRGLAKCRVVALLYALAHNLLQAVTLRSAAAAILNQRMRKGW